MDGLSEAVRCEGLRWSPTNGRPGRVSVWLRSGNPVGGSQKEVKEGRLKLGKATGSATSGGAREDSSAASLSTHSITSLAVGKGDFFIFYCVHHVNWPS